jgi:hypothetical protein
MKVFVLLIIIFSILYAAYGSMQPQPSYAPYTRGVSPEIQGDATRTPTDMVNVTVSFGQFGINGCPAGYNEITTQQNCFNLAAAILSKSYYLYSPVGLDICSAPYADAGFHTTSPSYTSALTQTSLPSGCFAIFEQANWETAASSASDHSTNFIEHFQQYLDADVPYNSDITSGYLSDHFNDYYAYPNYDADTMTNSQVDMVHLQFNRCGTDYCDETTADGGWKR